MWHHLEGVKITWKIAIQEQNILIAILTNGRYHIFESCKALAQSRAQSLSQEY